MTAPVTAIVPTVSAAPVAPVQPQLALQPGSVVTAQVIQLLENGFAQLAIEGAVIAALAEVPLQVGTTVQLAVSSPENGVLRLSVVPQGTVSAPAGIAAATGDVATAETAETAGATSPPAASPLRPSMTVADTEKTAVAVALRSAAPRQASLAPLFANLPVIVSSGTAPGPVQQGAAQLLGLRPDLSEQLSADDLRGAFSRSGLFLESTLAAGRDVAQLSDLKAALLVFRAVLADWLGSETRNLPQGPGPGVAPAAATDDGLGARAGATSAAVQPQSGAVAQMAAVEPILVGSSEMDAVEASASATPPQSAGAATKGAEIAGSTPAPSDLAGVARPLVAASLPHDAVQKFGPAAFDPLPATTVADELLPNAPRVIVDPVEALHAILRIAAGSQSLDALDTLNPPPASPRELAEMAPVTIDSPRAVPPPFRGSTPAAQPIAQPSLGDASPREIAHHLLTQTDAALARQTLLQIASLPDRDGGVAAPQPFSPDGAGPRWSFEIPFAAAQGTALVQFEIERDGGGAEKIEAEKRVWRAKFTLNIEPAGPVHATVSLIGDKTAVRFWAERSETAARLRSESGRLSQALREAALQPGDIVVASGGPPLPAGAKAGYFLDRAS